LPPATSSATASRLKVSSNLRRGLFVSCMCSILVCLAPLCPPNRDSLKPWEARYAELLRYKQAHGNCDVPDVWKENPTLGRWVSRQRQLKKQDGLSQERMTMLEEIGFNWGTSKRASKLGTSKGARKPWEARYAELLRYKQAHGNCDVPTEWKENPELGKWISNQRKLKKGGYLPQEQMRMLEEIGFNWGAREPWEARYAELLQFKKTHGHCDVPFHWKENPTLRAWVGCQRQCKKLGNLRPERERLLNEVGFIWDKRSRP
ncbi:MAG: helicase associated domain-containing protein, partial [Verrucomicrobia bacterium]|nr:helicase associated domain-containing protein [Verrucomicrobiota bacterium]